MSDVCLFVCLFTHKRKIGIHLNPLRFIFDSKPLNVMLLLDQCSYNQVPSMPSLNLTVDPLINYYYYNAFRTINTLSLVYSLPSCLFND